MSAASVLVVDVNLHISRWLDIIDLFGLFAEHATCGGPFQHSHHTGTRPQGSVVSFCSHRHVGNVHSLSIFGLRCEAWLESVGVVQVCRID